MRLWLVLSVSLTSLLLLGCESAADDDSAGDATDDDVADDDVADDDVADDDVADDDVADDDAADDDTANEVVDDNTCDEGATADTAMQFILADSDQRAIANLPWSIRDLDAATGEIGEEIAWGTTGPDGLVDVTLDCAAGWMVLHTSSTSHLDVHAFFRVMEVSNWPIVAMEESVAAMAIGIMISSTDEGVLAMYKLTSAGTGDLQQADSLRIDGSANLVPADASNALGMWLYDNAFLPTTAGIHFVSADLPDHGEVAEMVFDDDSTGVRTVLNAPIWSYDGSGSDEPGHHHITQICIVD